MSPLASVLATAAAMLGISDKGLTAMVVVAGESEGVETTGFDASAVVLLIGLAASSVRSAP